MDTKARLFAAKLEQALALIHEAFGMYELDVGDENSLSDAIDELESTAQNVEPTYGVQED